MAAESFSFWNAGRYGGVIIVIVNLKCTLQLYFPLGSRRRETWRFCCSPSRAVWGPTIRGSTHLKRESWWQISTRWKHLFLLSAMWLINLGNVKKIPKRYQYNCQCDVAYRLFYPHNCQKHYGGMLLLYLTFIIHHHLFAGLGAPGEGRARAGARPKRRADQTGKAGTDGEEIWQKGCHEGDLAPGEPEIGCSGDTSRAKLT